MLGTIRRAPAPYFGAFAALRDTATENISDHVTVTCKKRLGGAHFGAGREFAFRQSVAAILFKFSLTAVGLRSARAESAFVHLSAHAEGAGGRKLRCAEWACIRAITASDTNILVVQDYAFIGPIETIDWAHSHARCIAAVHARHRNGPLPGNAVIERNHPSAVHAPRYFMFVLTGRNAAVALNATLGITYKLHSCHQHGHNVWL